MLSDNLFIIRHCLQCPMVVFREFRPTKFVTLRNNGARKQFLITHAGCAIRVSFITVMFHVGYFTYSIVFYCIFIIAFTDLRIDVLMY